MEQRKVKLNLPFGFILTAAFLFSACGGHSSNFLPAANFGAGGAIHAPHPHATSGTFTLRGTIIALIHGGFTLNPGRSCGYLHIYTSSATSLTGPAPAVGLYAEVTGTGSCFTSMAATSITLSASPPATGTPSPVPSSSVRPYGSPTPYSSPGPPSTPIPYQSGSITASGPISGTFSGGFTINAGKSGYMHIYTDSSTVFAGGTPKAGVYAQSTGTGSMVTSVTARYVALYSAAPPTITVSGTVSAAAPYGFVEKASSESSSSSNSALPIVMNASTVVGGASLVTGSVVKVTGVGSRSEALLAQSIVVSRSTAVNPTPTPGPISQKHLLTADYLGTPYGTTSIAWSQAAPYLTWAQTEWQNANAISATGIKTQLYGDPNRTQAGSGDPLYTSDETTFAHDCSGNRVTDVLNPTVTQYVMAIGGSSMQTLFANYAAQQLGHGHYDALYEDDAGPLSDFIYTPFSAMPCNYSDSQWLAYSQELNHVSTVPIIFNGLELFNGTSLSGSIGLLQSSNTIGGNFEHCYSDGSQAEITGSSWEVAENTELAITAQQKLFECQLRNLNAASASIPARIYALASFLLTYNPSTSILWEEFATNSGLHVEPEEQLVALDPLAASPATVSGLVQTGGAYGRQYAQCYLAGKFVGACAVVVNPTSSPLTFPFPQYTHTLTLSGGGVLDGGTVATNGPAPGSTVGATTGVIAFP